MFFTIPTIMTWTRIVAIPLIVGVFYLPETAASQAERNLIATVMFGLFAATGPRLRQASEQRDLRFRRGRQHRRALRRRCHVDGLG